MIAPEEIVPTLENILADEAMFISKLRAIAPHSRTSDEVIELGKEIIPTFDAMKEMVEAVASNEPNPKPIGDAFKIAFNNIETILELLTGLLEEPAV